MVRRIGARRPSHCGEGSLIGDDHVEHLNSPVHSDSRQSESDQEPWRRQLASGLSALPIDLPESAAARLLAYLALLEKWNRAYNLTAVRDPQRMVSRHLLDSLAVLPWLRGPRVLDVGTGAGLPGIPLAVARPAWQFTLLDSNGKKVRFVRQVVLELGLENVEVVQARIETLRPAQGFDSITSRAFSTLREFVDGSAAALAPSGRWLAMKSADIDAELAELSAAGRPLLVERHPLQIPGEEAPRQLVVITRPQPGGSG